MFVMIRPRGGDFLYSDREVEVMKADIRLAKLHGADGLVFGALTEDGRIDTELCTALLGKGACRQKRRAELCAMSALPRGAGVQRCFVRSCGKNWGCFGLHALSMVSPSLSAFSRFMYCCTCETVMRSEALQIKNHCPKQFTEFEATWDIMARSKERGLGELLWGHRRIKLLDSLPS